jgi:hypothetical protein
MYRNSSHTPGGRRVTGFAIRTKRRIGPVLTCRAGDPVEADADQAIHRALRTTSVYYGLKQDAARAGPEVPAQDPVATEKPNPLSYRRVDDHGEGRRPIPTCWRRSVWRPAGP